MVSKFVGEKSLYDFDLLIALLERFTKEQIDKMKWYPDYEDLDWYKWRFDIDNNYYNLTFHKDTEDITLEIVNLKTE